MTIADIVTISKNCLRGSLSFHSYTCFFLLAQTSNNSFQLLSIHLADRCSVVVEEVKRFGGAFDDMEVLKCGYDSSVLAARQTPVFRTYIGSDSRNER
jgi:hypothetical protein